MSVNGSDRNVRCLQCKKKLKECMGHEKRYFIHALILVLITLALIFVASQLKTEDPTPRAQRTIKVHLQHRMPTPWLLQGNESPEQVIAFIEEWTPRIPPMMEKYRDISDVARKITDLGPYSVGVMSPIGGFISAHPEVARSQVIFYPAALFNQMPSVCWYKREYQGILVAAIPWPPVVLEGMLMHEGLHHVYDLEGRPSSMASHGSSEFAGEEIEAHQLEARVFDRGSGGAYLQIIDQAIGQFRNGMDPKSIMAATTPAQLDALDRALGCDPCTQRLANVLVNEHLLAIGMRYVGRQGFSATEERRKNVELYNWISSF